MLCQMCFKTRVISLDPFVRRALGGARLSHRACWARWLTPPPPRGDRRSLKGGSLTRGLGRDLLPGGFS